MAAIAGHPWIVEVFLLCNTAGLDDQDHEQNTALHYASSLNWGEVVISLLERGANETIENKVRYTDLRDDRAMFYFDLNRNETRTFRLLLNASYPGRYYLPGIQAEGMYDNDYIVRTSGSWVEVVQ